MKQVAKFLRTAFTEYLLTTASEIPRVSFLKIFFFVSLDKSLLLHRRCLISKFSEILILVCRKIFSAFYPILHETFSNSYGFPLMQEFNPFYPHLVLYDRKIFLFNLDWFEQLFNFVSSKVPFAKLRCEECSYKTAFKNTEAAIPKCSSEAVTQRCSVEKVFLDILQNSQENNCTIVSLLIKLQASASACNFNKKETLAQVFSCEFYEISKNTFSYRAPVVAASSSSKEVFLQICQYSRENICIEVPF